MEKKKKEKIVLFDDAVISQVQLGYTVDGVCTKMSMKQRWNDRILTKEKPDYAQ